MQQDVGQSTDTLLKDNHRLSCYREQLWTENLRIFVEQLLLRQQIPRIIARVRKRLLMMASFTFTSNQESRAPAKRSESETTR